MKRLLVTGSLALTVLLAGCAGMDSSGYSEGTFLGQKVEHPDPYTEMTKSPG